MNNLKNEILDVIKSYEQDYDFLSRMDKEFFMSSTKEENEHRESEMALIDGFISTLKSITANN